jgi:hypothetical protein
VSLPQSPRPLTAGACGLLTKGWSLPTTTRIWSGALTTSGPVRGPPPRVAARGPRLLSPSELSSQSGWISAFAARLSGVEIAVRATVFEPCAAAVPRAEARRHGTTPSISVSSETPGPDVRPGRTPWLAPSRCGQAPWPGSTGASSCPCPCAGVNGSSYRERWHRRRSRASWRLYNVPTQRESRGRPPGRAGDSPWHRGDQGAAGASVPVSPIPDG